MQFFNILVYVIMLIMTLSCLTVEHYISFMYLGNGLICALSIIISLLYLFYGTKLANYYSAGKDKIEIKERTFIHNRVSI